MKAISIILAGLVVVVYIIAMEVIIRTTGRK